MANATASSAPEGLSEQVQLLIAAHEMLAETVDRRLRSLEESTARAEAEVRFMATVLGEHGATRPASKTPGTGSDTDGQPRGASIRSTPQAVGESDEGTPEGVTA